MFQSEYLIENDLLKLKDNFLKKIEKLKNFKKNL